MWPNTNYDHVSARFDRMGNMVFIGDEIYYSTLNPAYFTAAHMDSIIRNGVMGAQVWWM